MENQTFKGRLVLLQGHIVLPLPFDPNQVWGERIQHHVTGTINGSHVRGPLKISGDHFYLFLGPTWSRNTGLNAGIEVQVSLAPEGPQADLLAPDIRAALEKEPQAAAFFKALPTFYRKNYLRWVEGAKRLETRQARILEMMELLKAGQKQRS